MDKDANMNMNTNLRLSCIAAVLLTLGAAPAWAQAPAPHGGMDMPSAAATQDMGPASAAMPGMPSNGTGAMPGMHHAPAAAASSQAPGTTGQAAGMQDMSGMGGTSHGAAAGSAMPMAPMQGGSAPPDARDPNAYSGGYTLDSGPYTLTGVRPPRLGDEHSFGTLLIDRLERVYGRDGNATAYDAQGWFGRDQNKLVLKAEGDVAQGRLQSARTEVLWGHAAATFWDTQLGLRNDSGVGPARNWLAFGVQGIAPYWFDIEATGYLGDQGRSALRLAASYDVLLTQKLIAQPRIDANAYGKSDPARDIGSGLSNLTAGLRLRYEFTRQFAPYVGVEWAGKFGQTADLARAAGERPRQTRLVAGVRLWF